MIHLGVIIILFLVYLVIVVRRGMHLDLLTSCSLCRQRQGLEAPGDMSACDVQSRTLIMDHYISQKESNSYLNVVEVHLRECDTVSV